MIKDPTLCYIVIHQQKVASGCLETPASALAFKSDRLLYVENEVFRAASKLTVTRFEETAFGAEYPRVVACVEDKACRSQLPKDFAHFFIEPQAQYWRAEAWFDPETYTIEAEQSILEPRITLMRSKSGSFLFIVPSLAADEMYKYYLFD
ncbi:hypothetical protein [Celeribacter sp. SCSIO 80788]|uniref:hypothetical protein n=1 Tax=Celeribacter sp. SCSIO 80788 TaxID=3117013 RepID=UPI003DA44815